jgi:hypothetical protein
MKRRSSAGGERGTGRRRKTPMPNRNGSKAETWASSVWKPSEDLKNANVPLDLLDKIAIVVDAQNPMALQKRTLQRTFPDLPMDFVLFLIVVMFEDYKQKSHSPKQIRQIERVAQISIELENAINHLEEPARLRLHYGYGLLKPFLDEARSIVGPIGSPAQPREKKAPHRPVSTFKRRALSLLVAGLYLYIVEKARGKLTLWQDAVTGELKGTLPGVLELLRPHLPGVLPEKMHFSTLRRALARAKSQ